MLNTKRSIDFEELLEGRVVLELEEIRSGAEKSLIMGFILTNLLEAIKAKYLKKGASTHITLVEEAHRLLSKYVPGENPNKKHGVDTFADMLAEIRKYGESLIIVDQIPNKLTSEVLKNTSTKIVHKLFAEDDKEAIGNTIVLKKEQKDFLSNLEPGRAVFFAPGIPKAVQIQIDSATNTTAQEQIHTSILRENVLQYYAKHYKKGIIVGSQYFCKQPSIDMIEKLLEISYEDDVNEEFLEYCKITSSIDLEFISEIRKIVRGTEVYDFLEGYFSKKEVCYNQKNTELLLGMNYVK